LERYSRIMNAWPAGACPGAGNNLDLAAEQVSVPAPRVVTALAPIVASLLLVACSHTVAGSATADPAAVARVAQERACRSAGDAIVTAVRTMVQRVDSGGFLDGPTADAMISEVPLAELGTNLAGSCGREMISGEYSRLLVELNAESAATIFGRIALNAAITGLCRVDGTTIVLDQQARLVCAGRPG
jgi:hypothetical protein